MAGLNKRPRFQSKAHAEWFEKTPKYVLYEILRDIAFPTFASEEEGQAHWLEEAKDRQRILKANGII